nr:hypothetical protein [Brevibacillus laterosporus]
MTEVDVHIRPMDEKTGCCRHTFTGKASYVFLSLLFNGYDIPVFL